MRIFLKDDIYFWLVLKLEISYHRVIIFLKDLFWFLLEDFFEDYVYFCYGEIFEFP